MVCVGNNMNNVRELLGIKNIHKQGIMGEGITIAIIDSGISNHIDYEGRVKVFRDYVNRKNNMYDDNGHGTHIAGIIAGDGVASDGKYMGICPKAKIISIKVLDHEGKGLEENVVKASKWIIDNKINYGIDIVNISFGTTDVNSIGNYMMKKAVEQMWNVGIVVVAAAGNNGPEDNTVTSPGIVDKIITVGALDDIRPVNINGRYVSDYSGRGMTGANYIKPEVIAPATMIKSCDIYNNLYTVKSGTSMATPIVGGCIGLFLCKYPGTENNDIKTILKSCCDDRRMAINRQGFGLINIKKLMDG